MRLSIKLTGDILSISEFSKFTEIYKNVTDPPYLVVKFASNSTTINDNLQFINDVATLDIKNFKNERLVFTLYRIFQSINIFYNIDEEISIEMGRIKDIFIINYDIHIINSKIIFLTLTLDLL